MRANHPGTWKRAALLIALAVEMLAISPSRSEGVEVPPTRDFDIRRDAVVNAIEKVLPCVVNIEATVVRDVNDPEARSMSEWFGWKYEPQYQEVPFSRGSGVVIDEEGYVLTNVHVIKGAKRVFVKFNDGTEEIEADRVELNQRSDVALLKLKAPGRRFRAVKYAKDDDLLLGETVIALGNPFGFEGSVTRGILSSKPRRGAPQTAKERGAEGARQLDTEDWIQTDASINPGNSGGPLINLRGELIGINVAVLRPETGAQGIGFAIPVKRILEALAEMLSGESVGGFWFGARLKPEVRPLVVQAVQPGSPAAIAGIKKDDAILSVNGSPSLSMIEFNRALVANGDHGDIKISLRRMGQTQEVSLKLVKETEFFNNDLLRARLGLTVRTVRNGLAVSSVEPSGPAARAGIQAGMSLYGADGAAINDLVQFAKLVSSKPRGAGVDLELVVYERSLLGVRQYEANVELKTR